MNNYVSPEIEIIEFSVADVLTNSQVVTTHPAGINVGGNGGDGYIDLSRVKHIAEIVNATDAKIVLSSSFTKPSPISFNDL